MFSPPDQRQWNEEMFAFFAEARYLPCPQCGASLIGEEPGRHTCDPERRIEFQMFRLRGELAALDQEVADYLDSPQGRFEVWYAEHRRAA